jgi:hypothetical protein
MCAGIFSSYSLYNTYYYYFLGLFLPDGPVMVSAQMMNPNMMNMMGGMMNPNMMGATNPNMMNMMGGMMNPNMTSHMWR